MDDFRDRTISRIFNAVIDGSAQYASACPPREKWSWRTFWNKFHKKEVNNEEVMENKPKEYRISDKIYKTPKCRSYVADIEALCNPPSYCNIKMQDPCEICCCSECRADEDSPCEGVPRGQRRSVCECDPQEKFRNEHECCDACEHNGLRRV